jgi:hypothetical protein
MKTPPKLLDHVRQKIRLRHYSIRTEDAYVLWIRRFILFRGNTGYSRRICAEALNPTRLPKCIAGELSKEAILRSFQHSCLAQRSNHQALGGRLRLRRPSPPRCRTFPFAPALCVSVRPCKERSFSDRNKRSRTGTVSWTDSNGR